MAACPTWRISSLTNRFAAASPRGRSTIIESLLRTVMEKEILDDIKELFQAFIAPQLEGIKGDIRAPDTKIGAFDVKSDSKFDLLDSKINSIDMKLESYRRELVAEIHATDHKIDKVEQTLSTDFKRLE